MKAAEILSRPDDGLRFLATELVRAVADLTPKEALERALSEMRQRGAEPTYAGICTARQAAIQATRERRDRILAQWPAKSAASRESEEADNVVHLRAPDETPKPATPPARYHPVTGVLDMRPRLASVVFDPNATFRSPSWLVKGILPHQGIALIVGESGAGKTFLAIHTALSVAWGLPFFGRRTRAGGVLYVAAEGGSSVLPRLRAADAALGPAVGAQRLAGNPLARGPLRVVTEAPDLSRDGNPLPLVATIEDAAAEFAAKGSRLALVVIDTWHAAMGGGDENSAADAGAALAPLRAAAEAHGALVVIVHHSGKDAERGARGTSALPAAADAIIALTVPGHAGPVAKPSDALRAGVVTKVRDGEAGEQLSYRLPIVQLGEDDDGDPWTTCVVEPTEAPKLDAEGLSATDRELMEAVRAALLENGSSRIKVDEARLRFYTRRPDAKPDARRMAWQRAFKRAIEGGRVAVDEHDLFLWLPSELTSSVSSAAR